MEKYISKCILIGSENKTEFRRKYLGDKFTKDHLIVLGADFSVKSVHINDLLTFEFQIWDINGSLGYEALRKRFYTGTNSVILILDEDIINNIDLIDFWFFEMKQITDNDPINLITFIPPAQEKTTNEIMTLVLSKIEQYFGFNISYFDFVETNEENSKIFDDTLSRLSWYIFNIQINREE